MEDNHREGNVYSCAWVFDAVACHLSILPGLHCNQVTSLETHKSFVGHARSAGLEPLESFDKTTSMAVHFKTLLEVMFRSTVHFFVWFWSFFLLNAFPLVALPSLRQHRNHCCRSPKFVKLHVRVVCWSRSRFSCAFLVRF